MLIAAIGAIAVGFAVISHSAGLQAEMGTYRTALKLTANVDPYQEITQEMLTPVEIPQKFFNENVFLENLEEVAEETGRTPVSATYLQKGALLQKSMVVAAPDLEQGERELAIMIDAETGVAGKVTRQSRVDVYAAFQPGDRQDACEIRVLSNIEVLDVGELGSEVDEETGGTNSVVPVTFRLTPEEALKLGHAEAFSSGVRLGLVSPEGGGDPGRQDYCSADQIAELEDQEGRPGNEPEAGDSAEQGADEETQESGN